MVPPAAQTEPTLYGVQVLRGIAALLVVLFHARLLVATPAIGWLFRNGAGGVDIFFIISGIVMALTAGRFTPGAFLEKRLLRIVPLYWLFLAAKLATLLFADISSRKLALDLGYVVKSFLFIPAYDGDGKISPLIAAGWTLSFELYFYGLCAVALFLRRAHFIAVTVLMVGVGTILGGLLSFWPMAHPPAELSILAPISLEFAAGMAVAWLWRDGFRLSLAWAAALVLAGAVALALAPPYNGQLDPLRPLFWGVPALAVVAGTLFLEPHVAFRRWTLPILLGDASYSLYLAHTAILPIAFRLFGRVTNDPPTRFVGIVASAVVFGLMVHLALERPLNRLAKRLMGRAAGAGPAVRGV